MKECDCPFFCYLYSLQQLRSLASSVRVNCEVNCKVNCMVRKGGRYAAVADLWHHPGIHLEVGRETTENLPKVAGRRDRTRDLLNEQQQ